MPAAYVNLAIDVMRRGQVCRHVYLDREAAVKQQRATQMTNVMEGTFAMTEAYASLDALKIRSAHRVRYAMRCVANPLAQVMRNARLALSATIRAAVKFLEDASLVRIAWSLRRIVMSNLISVSQAARETWIA